MRKRAAAAKKVKGKFKRLKRERDSAEQEPLLGVRQHQQERDASRRSGAHVAAGRRRADLGSDHKDPRGSRRSRRGLMTVPRPRQIVSSAADEKRDASGSGFVFLVDSETLGMALDSMDVCYSNSSSSTDESSSSSEMDDSSISGGVLDHVGSDDIVDDRQLPVEEEKEHEQDAEAHTRSVSPRSGLLEVSLSRSTAAPLGGGGGSGFGQGHVDVMSGASHMTSSTQDSSGSIWSATSGDSSERDGRLLDDKLKMYAMKTQSSLAAKSSSVELMSLTPTSTGIRSFGAGSLSPLSTDSGSESLSSTRSPSSPIIWPPVAKKWSDGRTISLAPDEVAEDEEILLVAGHSSAADEQVYDEMDTSSDGFFEAENFPAEFLPPPVTAVIETGTGTRSSFRSHVSGALPTVGEEVEESPRKTLPPLKKKKSKKKSSKSKAKGEISSSKIKAIKLSPPKKRRSTPPPIARIEEEEDDDGDDLFLSGFGPVRVHHFTDDSTVEMESDFLEAEEIDIESWSSRRFGPGTKGRSSKLLKLVTESSSSDNGEGAVVADGSSRTTLFDFPSASERKIAAEDVNVDSVKWDLVYLTASPLVARQLSRRSLMFGSRPTPVPRMRMDLRSADGSSASDMKASETSSVSSSGSGEGAFFALPMLPTWHEKRNLFSILNGMNHELKVIHEIATKTNLSKAVSEGCKCLHFSGHGFRGTLAFEDAQHCGESYLMRDEIIRKICMGRIEFVFASACHSEDIGFAFIKAGVKHVVAVEAEVEISDEAAITFTKHFYHSLLNGRSIDKSFKVARNAVVMMTDISRLDNDKFLLLPRDSDHSRVLFGKPVPGRLLDASTKWTPNNLPTVEFHFVGRQMVMHEILRQLISPRVSLLNIVGVPGVGKSATALMIARYLAQRSLFKGGILFIDVHLLRTRLPTLEEMLVETLRRTPLASGSYPPASISKLKQLMRLRVGPKLLVIDGVDSLGLDLDYDMNEEMFSFFFSQDLGPAVGSGKGGDAPTTTAAAKAKTAAPNFRRLTDAVVESLSRFLSCVFSLPWSRESVTVLLTSRTAVYDDVDYGVRHAKGDGDPSIIRRVSVSKPKKGTSGHASRVLEMVGLRKYALPQMRTESAVALFARVTDFLEIDVMRDSALCRLLDRNPRRCHLMAQYSNRGECKTLEDVRREFRCQKQVLRHREAQLAIKRKRLKTRARAKRKQLAEMHIAASDAQQIWCQAHGLQSCHAPELCQAMFEYWTQAFDTDVGGDERVSNDALMTAIMRYDLDDFCLPITRFNDFFDWFQSMLQLVKGNAEVSHLWKYRSPILIHSFDMTRKKACAALSDAREGTFLMRLSYRRNRCVVISLKTEETKKALETAAKPPMVSLALNGSKSKPVKSKKPVVIHIRGVLSEDNVQFNFSGRFLSSLKDFIGCYKPLLFLQCHCGSLKTFLHKDDIPFPELTA